MKKLAYLFIISLSALLSACQTLPSTPTSPTSTHTAPKFSITGKIGVTTVTPNGTQAGSAFYSWAQEEGRFGIDLTGALGIGATTIRYDGKTASLTSEKTGTIEADSPEALLVQATGWHAPISQLPYWILGISAPSDTPNSQKDAQGRLISAENTQWTAHFEYTNSTTPTRLRITHADGHRVVMTIAHQR